MERVRNIEPMYQPKDILPQASIPRKINKQPLKHNTQNNYIFTIKKIHKYYTNEDIKDNDDIIKAIRGEPFNYKNVVKQFPYFLNERYIYDFIIRWTKQLREVAGIFSRINGFTFFRKRIVPYIDVLNKIQQDKRDATTIDEELKLKLSFNPNDILPNLDKLPNNYEKLLYLLLTLIPTRRAHDYRYTKNTSSIPDDTIDKSFNYYFDKHIYIFNTKNKKFFDLLLPDEIIPYINTQTEFIFGDKLITHDKMSNNIKSIFKKIYGHPYNATLIRRLYATYSRENLTKKQIKLNAIAMGHSLTENLNYTFD